MLKLEQSIINEIINSEDYYFKFGDILKKEFFKDIKLQTVFSKIMEMIEKFDKRPTYQELVNYMEMDKTIKTDRFEDIKEEVIILSKNKEKNDEEIFKNLSLKFCKERALRNSLFESMEIIKSDKDFSPILEKIEKAIAINIDDDMGFDIFDAQKAKERFAQYRDVNTLKSGFKSWDDITGGLEPGTLNIIQAPTNGGKTLSMAFLATQYALQGHNVLYVTCEMADYKIALRQEASLCDAELDVFRKQITDVDQYMQIYDMMCKSNPRHGVLWVKEFPTGTANYITVKNLIKKLKTQKNIKFDLVIIDYLAILSTTKRISFDNTYAWQLAVAIELRGLAMSLKIPFLSAMQMNREAMKKMKAKGDKADVGTEDMSGSIGVAQTIDTLITQVPIPKEQCTQYLNDKIKGIYKWISNKTRNTDTKEECWYIGVNGSKMSLYETNNEEMRDTKLNNKIMSEVGDILNDVDWADEFGEI